VRRGVVETGESFAALTSPPRADLELTYRWAATGGGNLEGVSKNRVRVIVGRHFEP
jgi:hypothetical protein